MATTVLIVDDHPGFRASARMLLEAEGYDVVGEAGDGRPRLVAAAELNPDVVLLDIQLPDMDGFEVAAGLAPNGPLPAVVLISSRDVRGLTAGWHRSGARGFIPKSELSGAALEALSGEAGLRRALVGLGVAGFIAGAVPLVLALSAPDDINDPALICASSGRSWAGRSSAPGCSPGTGAPTTTSAR